VHYYRCVACGEVWSSPDHNEPGHSAEAA